MEFYACCPGEHREKDSGKEMNVIKKIRLKISSLEFRLLKLRANRYGYTLKGYQPPADNEVIFENLFKTSFSKNALLSYIVEPFKASIRNYHSNHAECYLMADILKELEYNVDVINWDNNTYWPDKTYDLVLDNHNNLKRLAPLLPAHTIKIFHATNTYWLYQNSVEYQGCLNFFKKKGALIAPTRLRPEGDSIAFADKVSMFGNEFTAATYGVFEKKIVQLPMSVTIDVPIGYTKDFGAAKTRFLWLNSHGAILKGLDVVIQVFAGRPDLDLFICCDLNRDQPFFKAVEPLLAQAPNIHVEGWVDTNSDHFKKLVAQCCWVISTSRSEGGGGSILNCMSQGLIPVISKSCSITLPEGIGYYIDNSGDTDAIICCLRNLTILENDVLNRMSQKSIEFINENHTRTNFRDKYRKFLADAIQERNS